MTSRFKHGENVVLNFGKSGIISGVIAAIKFTELKVLYDIYIYPFAEDEYKDHFQTLKDIDSYYVELPEDRFTGKSNIGIVNTDN